MCSIYKHISQYAPMQYDRFAPKRHDSINYMSILKKSQD